MKKILVSIFILIFVFCITSCSKRRDYFTDSELEKFGLNNLQTPNNATNYYNKSSKTMLFCYMTVTKDDDVRDFVLNVLDMLENDDMYKMYGYTKNDDMYKEVRNIYLSKDINDYQINTNNYSKDSVTFNSYEIYYYLSDETKEDSMFIFTITSYTEKDTIYLSGYNLIISVVQKNSSNYNVVNNE
ncbi:MAG: hypothetical protein IJX78_07540 [Bacilli bacterium]|nr:hypothetical protein [Bacilli bacterium]